MKSAKELREQRAEAYKQIEQLREDREKRKADWSETDEKEWDTKWDRCNADIAECDREIQIADAYERGQGIFDADRRANDDLANDLESRGVRSIDAFTLSSEKRVSVAFGALR